jgi:hypothetical protein
MTTRRRMSGEQNPAETMPARGRDGRLAGSLRKVGARFETAMKFYDARKLALLAQDTESAGREEDEGPEVSPGPVRAASWLALGRPRGPAHALRLRVLQHPRAARRRHRCGCVAVATSGTSITPKTLSSPNAK